MGDRNPFEGEEILFSNKKLVITNNRIIDMEKIPEDIYNGGISFEDAANVRANRDQPWVASVVLIAIGFLAIYLFSAFLFGLAAFAVVAALWYFKKDMGELNIFHDVSNAEVHEIKMPYEEAKEAATIIEKKRLEPYMPEPEPTSTADLQSEAVEIDIGSAQERYERAGTLWDTKDETKQEQALIIYERMIEDGVDLDKPYKILSTIYSVNGVSENAEKILHVKRKQLELAPSNNEYNEEFRLALYTCGKKYWDREEGDKAFGFYIEGLENLIETNGQLTQSSPVQDRIAFLACRMFSKSALERDNPDLGARFFDWCEAARIDPNEDFDIEDARS